MTIVVVIAFKIDYLLPKSITLRQYRMTPLASVFGIRNITAQLRLNYRAEYPHAE